MKAAVTASARLVLARGLRSSLAIAVASRPASTACDRRLLSSTTTLLASPRRPSGVAASSAPSSSSSSFPNPSDASSKPVRKGPLRDEEIAQTTTQIRLVDPKSGSLAGPFNVNEILARVDRTRFRLEQVVPASDRPPRPSDPANPLTVAEMLQYPICKLIDKKEDFDRQRALKRKAKANEASSSSAASQKEVQLTWSVSGNDLSHKLSKAKKELIKGARINAVITTKSGGKKYIRGKDPAEDEKRDRLLRDVEEFLCSADEAEAVSDADGAATIRASAIGRRIGEVEWQRGGSAAVISFEKIRSAK
ncbi:hypothetical protein ACQY0O_006257 [Thecaphora frezii]